MKNLLSIIGFVFIFSTLIANVPATSTTPTNIVILLDLSDRLLNPGQGDIDQIAIMEYFYSFEALVKSQLYIKSKDRFCIQILPQFKSSYDNDYFNNLLNIDLSSTPVAERRKRMDEFGQKLPQILKELYTFAAKNKFPADFAGVDIWKFFNNQLSYELLPDYNNSLVVITDGYFDFEDYSHVEKNKNRYTSTQFLSKLKSDSWRQMAEQQDYGILCIKKNFQNSRITIIGINPKNKDLFEQEKLIYFWEKWAGEMNFKNIHCIPIASEASTRQRIRRTFPHV